MIIHYESWQYECCGTPFKIGDVVRWSAMKLDDEIWYESHGEDEFIVEGKIVEITALYRTWEGDYFTYRELGERIENIADSESAFSEELLHSNNIDKSKNEDFYYFVIKLEDSKIYYK